ncbi:DUF2460 domain-containing protein [Qipengyuania sp. XHP0207]|uniref:DUF2460 domain-containing protein n=1 Tax=Qipengyuania sp. XHP0207 TaxID=3038078 RepID=UPI00241D1FF2|nr:DUF2460 domain-containing protein [Qipengyuania sp. XHP0207]MDG5748242.1 DUF2460 domain-containing protein [Qipengyuania sp. XHP0207]
MPFWLAREREGQHSDWIKRFDPRFWTVNFPRPMMASVVSTEHDAMRVDCEFHHKGELAGLIWESEDTLDHPLLAYETRRDYSHCVLRFRWRSAGILPLDVPHGPTLTIEGRDAAGNPRSWYVRLWNYASGSPTDARIELRFSGLESGYALPGEAVHVADIDRMFISLVPEGYVEGSTALLGSRVDAWAEMTEIDCQGERAMLEIGDVLLPPHGEGIATAYDDSFNQTPARLVRSIIGLGYRGRVIHYVGMSHFFRLFRHANGSHYVEPSGELCGPARRWHEAYFTGAVEAALAPIVSLSFEILAQHCPNWWRQRAHDGTHALTGWDPPSALLSPAHSGAVEFLKGAAAHFISLLEAAGGRALFQIGEPWWWTIPETGAPCFYDNTTKAALGGNPVVIDTLWGPLDDEQKALLDQAGAILSAATADLAAHVRSVANGPVEILLLTFTPTVLDTRSPDAWRANMPVGWAWPAFDRLQIEDYDWLTHGAEGARRNAYDFVEKHLGYPVEATDYMSGFVLLPEDADRFWPLIDGALDEARQRGISQRYVWALPQVARDGYTRLPYLEDDVQAFDDVSYPLALGRDAAVSPEFSTSVAVTASGHERRNALWSDARLRYDVGPGIRSERELGTLLAFFRARHGPARGFRFRDPYDFSSHAMIDAPGPGDQPLGTGDGGTTRFQLAKYYGEQRRTITRPRSETIRISVDGIETAGFTYEGKGWIRFDVAPAAGADIRAGFEFDVPVRFAEDRLDVSGTSFAAGEAPSVPLVELREDA